MRNASMTTAPTTTITSAPLPAATAALVPTLFVAGGKLFAAQQLSLIPTLGSRGSMALANMTIPTGGIYPIMSASGLLGTFSTTPIRVRPSQQPTTRPHVLTPLPCWPRQQQQQQQLPYSSCTTTTNTSTTTSPLVTHRFTCGSQSQSQPQPQCSSSSNSNSNGDCLSSKRCTHVQHWKRLRSKKGYAYYLCQACQLRWRTQTVNFDPSKRQQKPTQKTPQQQPQQSSGGSSAPMMVTYTASSGGAATTTTTGPSSHDSYRSPASELTEGSSVSMVGSTAGGSGSGSGSGSLSTQISFDSQALRTASDLFVDLSPSIMGDDGADMQHSNEVHDDPQEHELCASMSDEPPRAELPLGRLAEESTTDYSPFKSYLPFGVC